MNIALIGASGFIGSALLNEALERGHQVTAVVTHPERMPQHENLTPAKADVMDSEALAKVLAGHDAVISAFSGHAQDDVYGYYIKGVESILRALESVDAKRFLIVGGAASLEVAPGKLLFDTPEFPEQYKATAQGAKAALELLRGQSEQTWTMLSPAAEIFPGERTGRFQLGGDQLITDQDGNSRISVQDYAVAMIDELENPQHRDQRFTLGYV